MGLFKIKVLIVYLIIFFAPHKVICEAKEQPLASPKTDSMAPNHILFLMHTGDTAQALEEYKKYQNEVGSHDFELIERIGLILLDQGFRSRDIETQLLAMYGAGISINEKALYIIEDGLTSGQPELELISLSLLSRFQNDRADQAIHRAMASNSLLIRFEAALQLANKKDARALGQIDALMAKVDEAVWPLFAQIYSVLGTPLAKKTLRKFLSHHDENVRIATILSLAEHSHDDFLPFIRRLASHHEPAQQEACAAALGLLKDETSAPHLMRLARSPHLNTRLAALYALYQLGRQEVKDEIESLAKTQDLFAINLLGDLPGSEEALASLIKHKNVHVSFNAAIALLKLGDRRGMPLISEILFKNNRDMGALKITSQGKSLSALKVVSSIQQQFKDKPLALETFLDLREAILVKAIDLPEPDFLALAQIIFETQQNDLVPALIAILENHPTPAVVNLLKKYQQKVGAPLIRNYCNLALYRLKENGPYADNLRQWTTQQKNIDLIRFRPVLPWDLREKEANIFQLTPQETSRLLVEAFESFVSTQDNQGIDMLISIIQTGNPKNKYALIGLLMRAIQ